MLNNAQKKYNLLIITPDQLRADYLSCYGHPSINTKNIDKLASQGVRFDNCYCAAPLCAPSRISFATSTYVGEHNHRNYWSTISPDVPNLVTTLKKHGYRTGMFGKNHLFTYSRLNEVWDELDEICLGNCDDHPDYLHSYSSFTLDASHEYNITARLTNETIEFMKNNREPFLAWVNFQDPHPVFACPPPYDTLFCPEDVELPTSYTEHLVNTKPVRNHVWRVHSEMNLASDTEMRKMIAMYMGQIRYVDDCVGKMLGMLEEYGLTQNTLVLFFSDHGELLGDHGMTHKIPVFYDSLTRIPVILKHPDGKWQERLFKGLVEEVDLVPTLLSILGIGINATMVGKSLLNALESGQDTGRESILCEAGGGAPTLKEPIPGLVLKAPFAPTSFGPGAMLRKGGWKLSLYHDDLGELYDLDTDPNEKINLYEDENFRDIREELILLLTRRILGVRLRDIGIDWNRNEYPADVRFEPLEICD